MKKIKEWGKSLNNRLMGIILLCGIVPVIFIVLFVASLSFKHRLKNVQYVLG